MTKTTKIWISRDLLGDFSSSVYFWNKKPRWTGNWYECPGCGDGDKGTCNSKRDDHQCLSIIVSIDCDCSDLEHILEVMAGTGITEGQLLELKTTVSVSQGKTTKEKALSLVKKLKSKQKPTQKEIIKFLEEIAKEEADDEDEDKNKN